MRQILQQDSGDLDVHRDSPVFEGGGDEAAEGERRHDGERKSEERVRSGENRVHVSHLGQVRRTKLRTISQRSREKEEKANR